MGRHGRREDFEKRNDRTLVAKDLYGNILFVELDENRYPSSSVPKVRTNTSPDSPGSGKEWVANGSRTGGPRCKILPYP